MNQNNVPIPFEKLTIQKRRGVAEVISTLLLVVITVVGAVILTSFIDESFVSGSLAVTSGSDTTIKTIRLLGYDTRNGDNLMNSLDYDLDNTGVPGVLCRSSCTVTDTTPANGGSDFMVIQIENRGINSIFVKNVILDGVSHVWAAETFNAELDTSILVPAAGEYPLDGQFSILSTDTTELTQGDRQIESGEAVNLLIKLHSNDLAIPDIQLSKTTRVQVNIGEVVLADFLIETGDTR